MANISITGACNSNCSYCFAAGVVPSGSNPHMPLGAFARVLDLLERSQVKQVRLLGGEPTVHPRFPAFLRAASERDMEILVFSNGLIPEPSLRSLERLAEDAVKVLVNTTARSGVEQQKWRARSLERLGPRAILGANIFRPGLPLASLFDVIDSLGLARTIRLGIAHPRLQGDNLWLPPKLYPAVGREIGVLLSQAQELDIGVRFDCGFVPCMFPEPTQMALAAEMSDLGRRCSPILDILPDSTAIACYPLAALGRIAIDNQDPDSIRRRFTEQLAPLRSLRIYDDCLRCDLLHSGDCKGGCLAAAMQRMRSGPFTVARTARDPAGADLSTSRQ